MKKTVLVVFVVLVGLGLCRLCAPSASRSIPTPSLMYATVSARDERGQLLPGGVVNVWDNYQTRSRVVARCTDGERVQILERSGDGVKIRTSSGVSGWVSYWFLR